MFVCTTFRYSVILNNVVTANKIWWLVISIQSQNWDAPRFHQLTRNRAIKWKNSLHYSHNNNDKSCKTVNKLNHESGNKNLVNFVQYYGSFHSLSVWIFHFLTYKVITQCFDCFHKYLNALVVTWKHELLFIYRDWPQIIHNTYKMADSVANVAKLTNSNF